MKRVFILLLIFTTLLKAQVENSGKSAPYNFSPRPYLDITNFRSEIKERTRVDVFIQIPYSNIQFVKKGDKYLGQYSVTVTFMDEDKDDIITERVWNEKVSVDDFLITSSSKSYNLNYKKFDLLPGIYQVRLIAEDLDSKRSFTLEKEINVLDLSAPVALSDIILIDKKIQSPDGEKIIPNVSHNITTRDSLISFFYEIYSDTERGALIEYKIIDQEDNTIFSEQTFKDINTGITRIDHQILGAKFTLGEYDLAVIVKAENGDPIADIGTKIFSRIYGFPETIRNLDDAVEQMVYFTTSSDVDNIQDEEDYSTKLAKFVEFWKVQDPSPNTEENEILTEYFRRVDYANKNFKSYYAGWRTDMGMIYITLGPPNQVERHPYEIDSKPYEIWDYYDLNRRFIFVDETNFGDYRLLNPVYGDWYRYRHR